MKFKSLFTKAKSKAVVAKDKVKKYSPEILVGLGIIGFGATVYSACKATVRCQEIVAEHEELVEKTEVAAITNPMCKDGTTYTKEDAEKDRFTIKCQTGVKIFKTVAPAVTLGALSVASILWGFHIIKGRYVALGCAYKALETSYNKLYNNVKKEYGEEKAFELANGLTKVGTTDDGIDIYQKTDDSPIPGSPYAVYFCPKTSKYWDTSGDFANEFLLTSQQNSYNEKLKARGYILYEELLREFGIKTTPTSTRVGWLYGARADKARADGLNPDEYIDLRIKKLGFVDEMMKLPEGSSDEEVGERFELFKEGFHGRHADYIYMLDPNVDGEIWQYI